MEHALSIFYDEFSDEENTLEDWMLNSDSNTLSENEVNEHGYFYDEKNHDEL